MQGVDLEPLLKSKRLNRVLIHMKVRSSCRISTADAASIAGLQYNYFCNYFKVQTGLTFNEWQHRWRIQQIAERILKPDAKILVTAELFGYRYRAFERAFKSVYGMCARDFRRANKRKSHVL